MNDIDKQRKSLRYRRCQLEASDQLKAVLPPEDLAVLHRKVEANLRRLGSSEGKTSTRPTKSHEELPALRAAV